MSSKNQVVSDSYYERDVSFEQVLDQCESSSCAWVGILRQKIQSVV